LRFYANVGPARGPVRYRDVPGAIGVLAAPGNNMPIGMALSQGPDNGGIATWRLSVNGVDVPGEWVIIDREFRLAP
jgi:hypothetical protein